MSVRQDPLDVILTEPPFTRPRARPGAPSRYAELTKGLSITCNITKNTYVVGDLIGEGHFGVAYECTDDWNNRVVVKVLKERAGTDAGVLADAAFDEFQKLVLLRHPFITHVYDVFEVDGLYCVVTERCAFPLEDLFFPEFRPELWIMPIARCVLQAVEFIHANKMVHKDIHLGNVFFNVQRSELGTPPNSSVNFKVGDLGIANVIDDIVPETTLLAQWMLPPETIDPSFGKVDHRIDIYHCGLLFLQLMLGKKLAFTREEILAGVPRDLALELPAPYSLAIEKALRRRVDYRTENAKEFWRDLKSPFVT